MLVEEDLEPVFVPNFSAACRICQWSKTNIPVYNFISRLALRGMAYGAMEKELTRHVTENNITLGTIPVRRSIWNHFTKHLDVETSVTIGVARQNHIPEISKPMLTEEENKALKELQLGNFDEYKELCDLYIRFKSVDKQIYEFTSSLQVENAEAGPDGRPQWSQQKLQTFVSMVNTKKSILVEIAKMRQGDKLIKMAAQFSLQVFAKSIITKLSDEFNSLQSVMRSQNIDSKILEVFEQITHERLAQIILAEAESAMTSTSKEFKLPN